MKPTLPPLLQEITDVISFDAAIKIAEAFGGQRISVPGKVHQGHVLVAVLGMKDAVAFCHYFTGGSRVHLDVPFGPTSHKAQREARIAKMVALGKSANEIAKASQMTRRNAFHKKARYGNGQTHPIVSPETEKLPDLFDKLK